MNYLILLFITYVFCNENEQLDEYDCLPSNIILMTILATVFTFIYINKSFEAISNYYENNPDEEPLLL